MHAGPMISLWIVNMRQTHAHDCNTDTARAGAFVHIQAFETENI